RVRVVPAGEGGDEARTAYQLLRRWPRHALLRLWPHTGRTHQLRVHLAHAGWPICGDPVYNPAGSDPAHRLFLPAHYLPLLSPAGVRRAFRAPLPAGLHAALRTLEHPCYSAED